VSTITTVSPDAVHEGVGGVGLVVRDVQLLAEDQYGPVVDLDQLSEGGHGVRRRSGAGMNVDGSALVCGLPSRGMVLGWFSDGGAMAEVDKSEKITINIGLVDLGQIDLLVDEGFYANRTDFIRTAIRRQLEGRAAAVNSTVERRALTLGTQHLSRQELEALQDAGRQIELRVLGLATIADDVSPELALATIASVEVLGAFRASRAVKAALAPRTI
jgi:Arc/MetJ-type ribon-helix-helix transcriptional regulator